MKDRGAILRAHYAALLQKFGLWVGLVSMISYMFVSMPVSATAGILGTRSSTLSNSVSSATGVTATFLVTPGTSATIKGVKFSLCTSPLGPGSCTSPAGATMAAATAGSQLKNGSAIGNAYGAPTYTSTTDVCFTNATGNAFNGTTDTLTFPVANITLPNTVTEFYFRMQTFSSNDCTTTPVDFGGFAEDTVSTITVTDTVQESLTFCVGATASAGCATPGSASVALTPSPMLSNAASDGTTLMDVATNAQTGYVVSYSATQFTGPLQTIANYSSSASSPGTEGFGFNLKSNATPSVGANVSGSGTGTCTSFAAYCTANSFSYNTAGTASIASAAGPTVDNLFTIAYVANVAATTKTGLYTATQDFIATGTF